jgi:hypothetical protein
VYMPTASRRTSTRLTQSVAFGFVVNMISS